MREEDDVICVTLCVQDFDNGFRSKFGVNLLGAEDLGLQVKYVFACYQLFFLHQEKAITQPLCVGGCCKPSIYPPHLLSPLLQDSDKEEEAGGSSEDVSQELRKVLELDQSEEDESEEELGRPSAPLPIPSTITRVSEKEEGEGLDQQSSPRLRPSAARGNRAPSTQQPQTVRQSTPKPVGQSTPQPVVQPTTHSVIQSTPVVQSAGAGSGVPTVDSAGSTGAVIAVAKGPEEKR